MDGLPCSPEPSQASAKTLLEAFSELPGPRVSERCDHLLHEVLVIAVCGMLVGGGSFYDMEDFASESESWLRGFLLLPGGVPRHDTFNHVFAALCPRAFGECFARWTQGVRERLRRVAKLSRSTARRCAARAGATIPCAPS